jgi:hypothetical protein
MDSKIVELKADDERKRQALVNQLIESWKLSNKMLDGLSPFYCLLLN